MKTIIVYHNDETAAKRGYRPRPDETVAYRAIRQWDEFENAKFDQVINLATEIPSHLKSQIDAAAEVEPDDGIL